MDASSWQNYWRAGGLAGWRAGGCGESNGGHESDNSSGDVVANIPKIGHFVLRGSLGTGKAMVARVIAKIFHRMGILATDKLVETSGLDLTGEFVEQTKKKVETQLGEARGGLLFIDEAYELGKGHFGAEAMTLLVAAMMNPTYAGMLLCSLCGLYHWETEDRLKFAVAKSENDGYTLFFEAIESLHRTFDIVRSLPMLGNGRNAVQLWSKMLDCRAQRVQFTPEIVKTISFEDTDAAGQTFIAGRKPASRPLMHQISPSSGPIAMSSNFAHAPTHHRQTIHQDSKASEEPTSSVKTEEAAKDEDKWSDAERDPGVSDGT